jgi:hypothetical protein
MCLHSVSLMSGLDPQCRILRASVNQETSAALCLASLERRVQPCSQPPPVGDALAQRHLKHPQVRHGEVRVRVPRQQPPPSIVRRKPLRALQPHRQLGERARVILQRHMAGGSVAYWGSHTGRCALCSCADNAAVPAGTGRSRHRATLTGCKANADIVVPDQGRSTAAQLRPQHTMLCPEQLDVEKKA